MLSYFDSLPNPSINSSVMSEKKKKKQHLTVQLSGYAYYNVVSGFMTSSLP